MSVDDVPEKVRIVQSAYDKIAIQYDQDRARFHNHLQLDLFLKSLPADSKIVLDSGCGSGRILSIIQNRGIRTIGIDISKGMLKLSKQNSPESESIQMDMIHTGFQEETFGGIVAMYSFIHVPITRHKQVLENFRRLLRIGGCVLLCHGTGELEIVEEYKPYGVQNYWGNDDPKWSLDIIRELGFEVIFDKMLTQGGETFYWIIARKGN
jgi:ubiquinone/menaquinone biosynthesis C-methylase UbiE